MHVQGGGKERESLQRSPIAFHFHPGNCRKPQSDNTVFGNKLLSTLSKKKKILYSSLQGFSFFLEIDIPRVSLDIKSTGFVLSQLASLTIHRELASRLQPTFS